MQKLIIGMAGLILACSTVSWAQSFDPLEPASITGQTTRISAFSGKPVPRFESLKYAAVHGRTGPSLEYPVAWRYERQGLPVLVIKESRGWLKVRDPDGDEVWMHTRTVGGHPSVMVHGEELVEMKHRADANSRLIAKVEPGAIANLIECDGEFCRVYMDKRRGWVPRHKLWGAPNTSAAPVTSQIAQNTTAKLESQ